MSPRSDATRLALGLGGSLVSIGFALAVFLLLPESVARNDFVGGTIFASTILLCAGFARLTHPASRGHALGSNR